MTITESTTISEIVSELPSSVPLFQRHGVDFCCGGKRPLGAVCKDLGVSFATMSEEIRETEQALPTDCRDWNHESLETLMLHILATYHEPLREELPRLSAFAEKAAYVHGDRAPELRRISEVVHALGRDLQDHMFKEERILFPAIQGLERGFGRPTVAGPIAVMEHEHEDVGRCLAELRSLTNQYVPPDWGCGTVVALYRGLRDLEGAMHVHVHLENNVLFPRAAKLAERDD